SSSCARILNIAIASSKRLPRKTCESDEIFVLCYRFRVAVLRKKLLDRELQLIDACENQRRAIVPFTHGRGQRRSEVFRPPINQELRLGISDVEWLLFGGDTQFRFLANCLPQKSVNKRSNSCRCAGDGFVHGCVFRRFNQKKLVETESQQVTRAQVQVARTKGIDPEIEQA